MFITDSGRPIGNEETATDCLSIQCEVKLESMASKLYWSVPMRYHRYHKKAFIISYILCISYPLCRYPYVQILFQLCSHNWIVNKLLLYAAHCCSFQTRLKYGLSIFSPRLHRRLPYYQKLEVTRRTLAYLHIHICTILHIYILHNNYIVLDIGTLENVPLSLDLIHIYRITDTDCAV